MNKLSSAIKEIFTPGTPLCALAYAALGVILATLLLTPSLGYLGVCYTEPIAWILMAVFLLAAFYQDPRFRPGSHDESLDSSM